MTNIVDNDTWLRPFESVIQRRMKLLADKEKNLLSELNNLSAFSTGHLYFGLHRDKNGWTIRDWAPNASSVHLLGDFNNWTFSEEYALKGNDSGEWELHLAPEKINHLDQYKLHFHWAEGEGERIPAWAKRTLQNDETKAFNAQVWAPDKTYTWKNSVPDLSNINPIIYFSFSITWSR